VLELIVTLRTPSVELQHTVLTPYSPLPCVFEVALRGGRRRFLTLDIDIGVRVRHERESFEKENTQFMVLGLKFSKIKNMESFTQCHVPTGWKPCSFTMHSVTAAVMTAVRIAVPRTKIMSQ
jgi:hypothetical protein